MRSRRVPVGLLATIALGMSLPGHAKAESATGSRLAKVFASLDNLMPMRPGKQYTVEVGGQRETGPKERFLRRRTADEIGSSRLSSGCGDNAIFFSQRIEASGYETLFVDAAEISTANLNHHFSGHAVVALRAEDSAADSPWWLVDPTARRVLSKSWRPSEASYEASGAVYWIGYRGSLSDYPVKNGRELSDFYAATLGRVPQRVMNRTLYKIDFRVDSSLIDAEGEYVNPRIDRLSREQSLAFKRYGVAPEREVRVMLTRGGDDHLSGLTYEEKEGWVCTVGVRSACSPSMLAGLERQIRRHDGRKPSFER